MRERAKSFGGKLEVWSEHGAGTEIELSVPGAIAYGKIRTASQILVMAKEDWGIRWAAVLRRALVLL